MGWDDVPDRSIRICADRGGTFCDVHASYPDPENPDGERKEIVVKLLSQDTNYADAPTEGIRRVLQIVTGEEIPRGQLLRTDKIDYVRLSTTVATNALLERKGHKHALLITKGFKDLLVIGNQSRPQIFALNIQRAPVLYDEVVEVDERVTLVGYTSDPGYEEHQVRFEEDHHTHVQGHHTAEKDGDETPKIKKGYTGPGWDGDEGTLAEGPGRIVKGLSGEAVRVLREPDPEQIKETLQSLYDKGYTSLAIVFAHSYTYPHHELLVGELAKDPSSSQSSSESTSKYTYKFNHVSMSSQLLPMIKMVPRGVSATADAYLTPILYEYLEGFFSGFEGGHEDSANDNTPSADRNDNEEDEDADGAKRGLRVEFMGSDGGLVDLKNFSGLKSILSGPAGGVVGYALTSWDEESKKAIIGIDVGGTSTDVSRFAGPVGRYPVVLESTTAGITIQSPQLDINTVAAGGGSCLKFRNGLFVTGPESAGARPGPCCYRKGGPLAVTDANLILGRLLPEFFPKIFGPGENEGLDIGASKRAFESVVREVNAGRGEGEKEMSEDEVVYGFIKVANETMCRPIRTLTEAKGYATSNHILASFGGAGGQHACEIAQILGIKTILIHRYSSILSAYGLALADRAFELQEPSSTPYTDFSKTSLIRRLDSLEAKVRKELARQGFEGKRVRVERMLNMRFDGTDTALMIVADEHLGETREGEGKEGTKEDYLGAFRKEYKEQFGFLLDEKNVIVDDVKVRGIGKTYDSLGPSVFSELKTLEKKILEPSSAHTKHSVYFHEVGRVDDTPVFLLGEMNVGDCVKGPAMIIDETQTIVIIPGSEAVLTSRSLIINVDVDKNSDEQEE